MERSTYPAERDHVECVPSSVEFIKEVIVGAVRGVIHLQLTAGSPEYGIQTLQTLIYILPLITTACACSNVIAAGKKLVLYKEFYTRRLGSFQKGVSNLLCIPIVIKYHETHSK